MLCGLVVFSLPDVSSIVHYQARLDAVVTTSTNYHLGRTINVP